MNKMLQIIFFIIVFGILFVSFQFISNANGPTYNFQIIYKEKGDDGFFHELKISESENSDKEEGSEIKIPKIGDIITLKDDQQKRVKAINTYTNNEEIINELIYRFPIDRRTFKMPADNLKIGIILEDLDK